MEKIIEIKDTKFVFCQSDEFSSPFYSYVCDDEVYGYIGYVEDRWQGSLNHSYQYGSGIFKEMAEKLDQLNADLIKNRKEFFGIL